MRFLWLLIKLNNQNIWQYFITLIVVLTFINTINAQEHQQQDYGNSL